MAFYDWRLGITEYHFCCILLVNPARSPPRFKGGDIAPTSWWEDSQRICSYVLNSYRYRTCLQAGWECTMRWKEVNDVEERRGNFRNQQVLQRSRGDNTQRLETEHYSLWGRREGHCEDGCRVKRWGCSLLMISLCPIMYRSLHYKSSAEGRCWGGLRRKEGVRHSNFRE